MTFYLKYRPQKLEELDQELVRSSLTKIFASDDIPHAFLFSGPRGTGKTSAARIVAKILNCEKQSRIVEIEPCNECFQCKSITRGESLDVIELDAASHRGIDDVRQIREAIKLAPVLAKKKVYIVDEAHMLTTEASNALLKTLEEPPSHVVFILATTNPEKLLETISSRVTNVKFKKATDVEIVRSLKRIAIHEKIKIDEDALTEIAMRVDGSFRDAVKNFEQVVMEVEKLSTQNVTDFLVNTKSFVVGDFLKGLADKNAKESVLMINSAIDGGLGAKEIIKMVLVELRQMLLGTIGVGEVKTENFDKESLINLIDLFTNASAKLPYSYIEEVPLEVVIIKWCEDGKDSTSIKSSKSRKGEEDEEGVMLDTGSESSDKVKSQKAKVEDDSTNGFLGEIDEKVWAKVLSQLGSNHASTEALLKATHPLGLNGNTLKLGVYYKFHKEHLESNAHRKVLEDTLNLVTGNTIRIVCELTEQPKKIGRDVLLTEPNDTTVPASVLTNQHGEDIMKIAKDIFSN